jgi:hypothetical protein
VKLRKQAELKTPSEVMYVVPEEFEATLQLCWDTAIASRETRLITSCTDRNRIVTKTERRSEALAEMGPRRLRLSPEPMA